MLLDYPRQAPVGDHQKQNDYDYNFKFDVAFWMRGKPDRVALIMAPWEPGTSANVLLMVRLTCIAEQYSNISVLSEAWGLPEGQQQIPGKPIGDHECKTECVTAAYYWSEDGQLYQRSRAGLLVRNDKGRVIRKRPAARDHAGQSARAALVGSVGVRLGVPKGDLAKRTTSPRISTCTSSTTRPSDRRTSWTFREIVRRALSQQP